MWHTIASSREVGRYVLVFYGGCLCRNKVQTMQGPWYCLHKISAGRGYKCSMM